MFFLIYLAISILFAHRQPIHLKGYIDGTLVFGLPVAVFGLQSCLIQEYAYGTALSSLVMGGLYIFVAWRLWNRQVQGMRPLTESFLSLGIAFATITIPLGLNSDWTTGLWSLEGAGADVSSSAPETPPADALADAPPVVIAHDDARPEIEGELDGYVVREHRFKLWSEEIVVFLDRDALAGSAAQ